MRRNIWPCGLPAFPSAPVTDTSAVQSHNWHPPAPGSARKSARSGRELPSTHHCRRETIITLTRHHHHHFLTAEMKGTGSPRACLRDHSTQGAFWDIWSKFWVMRDFEGRSIVKSSHLCIIFSIFKPDVQTEWPQTFHSHLINRSSFLEKQQHHHVSEDGHRPGLPANLVGGLHQ